MVYAKLEQFHIGILCLMMLMLMSGAFTKYVQWKYMHFVYIRIITLVFISRATLQIITMIAVLVLCSIASMVLLLYFHSWIQIWIINWKIESGQWYQFKTFILCGTHSGLFWDKWVSTIAADALAPFIDRTSEAMVLTIQDDGWWKVNYFQI